MREPIRVAIVVCDGVVHEVRTSLANPDGIEVTVFDYNGDDADFAEPDEAEYPTVVFGWTYTVSAAVETAVCNQR